MKRAISITKVDAISCFHGFSLKKRYDYIFMTDLPFLLSVSNTFWLIRILV